VSPRDRGSESHWPLKWQFSLQGHSPSLRPRNDDRVP
jgi:hypothetical protein